MISVRINDGLSHSTRVVSPLRNVMAICLVLLPALLWAQVKPTLIWVTESDTLDFGSKIAGLLYRQDITIRNLGTEARTIDEWQAACPCLQVIGMPHKIDAGEAVRMSISLKTEAIDRNYYGSSVYLLTDDPVRPILRIPVKVVWTDEMGSVSPPPQPTPDMLPGQEPNNPSQAPLTPIPSDEQQEQDRERTAKNLSSDPHLDSLLQTLPDSLRDSFREALSAYTQRAFNSGATNTPNEQQPMSPSIPDSSPVITRSQDTLIDRPGELTERMFDSLSAVMRGETWIPPEATSSDWRIRTHQPLVLQLFHSMSCRVCEKATQKIELIVHSYGGRVMLRHYYTDNDTGLARYIEVQQKRKVRGDPFLLTVGNLNFRTFSSLDTLKGSIDSVLTTDFTEDTTTANAIDVIRSKLRNVTFWTLIGAGLLDGVNPCAFATLIFFITMIMYVGGRKKDVVLVGTLFSVTVFITYLLLGIGAFGILTELAAYRFIAAAIYIITAVIVLVLALMTLRDLWSYMNGAPPTDAILQLPLNMKRRIHTVMRDHLKPGKLALGAIVIGFLVTLFESICTGQVYLPTIVMLLRDPELSGQAWIYLVLYNVLFTAPLLIVFWLAYNGVTSKAIGDWSKRNYGWIKFALLLLFIALFVLMMKEIIL